MVRADKKLFRDIVLNLILTIIDIGPYVLSFELQAFSSKEKKCKI